MRYGPQINNDGMQQTMSEFVIPPPEDGYLGVEKVLETLGYSFTNGRIKSTSLSTKGAYVTKLLSVRRSRKNDMGRAEKMKSEVYRRSRNDWYTQRHKKRRVEASKSLDKTAWFNTTFLFANLKRRGLSCDVPRQIIIDISTQPCTYCGNNWSGGIDRVNASGNYTLDNIVACCHSCNIMKLTHSVDDFIRYCKDIHTFVTTGTKCTNSNKPAKKRKTYTNYRDHSARHEVSIDEETYNKLNMMECAYCGVSECNGIDRIDNDVHYTKENCVPACGVCNNMKWTQTTDEFLEKVKAIILVKAVASV